MTIEFNHTLIHARDAKLSATFLAEMLGLPEPTEYGPFQVVTTRNDVNLDFMKRDGEVLSRHFAFLVSEWEFAEIFERIMGRGLTHWADPRQEREGEVNHKDGGHGVYFKDPDGHMLEVITRPYGSGDRVRIERQVHLPEAPETVWQKIGDFGAIGDWHPMLDTVESEGNQVGARRVATGEDGGQQVERLHSYENTDRPHRRIAYGYAMEETAMPVADYEATFIVEEDGDGSRVTWTAEFEETGAEGAAKDMVRGFVEAGLRALPDFLANRDTSG